MDQKAAVTHQPFTPQEAAEQLITEERWRQVLTCLTVCLFGRAIYTPEVVLEAMGAAGFEWDQSSLLGSVGKRCSENMLSKNEKGFSWLNCACQAISSKRSHPLPVR